MRNEFAVSQLCQVLGAARGGFYRWRKSAPTARAEANGKLVEQMRQIHQAKRGNYGSPRMTEELRRRGHPCNHKRVERLMRQQGLRGRSARKRKVRTTDSQHDQPVAPNLLRDRPAPQKPDEVWVADITYIPTAGRVLYLAAVMDLYSRMILGWSLWHSLEAGGAVQALGRALVKRHHPTGVIHHSDRGTQYACSEYRQILQRQGLLRSMSRKGNCYDNAAMEAFWSTLKREELEDSREWSEAKVRRTVFEFIEANYNRSRLHSGLGYQSPLEFENQNK